jgi:hypothetical protein
MSNSGSDCLLNLASAVLSGDASEDESIELERILLADRASRLRYFAYCQMHVALRIESRARRAIEIANSQMNNGNGGMPLDVLFNNHDMAAPQSFPPVPSSTLLTYFTSGWPMANLLAAIIVAAGLAVMAVIPVSFSKQVPTVAKMDFERQRPIVAKEQDAQQPPAAAGSFAEQSACLAACSW